MLGPSLPFRLHFELLFGLFTLELSDLWLGNHCACASAPGVVNGSRLLLALILVDCELPWADVFHVEELLLLLGSFDRVHRGDSGCAMLLKALFDVGAWVLGEVAIVKAVLGFLLESHVRFDVFDLAWEVVAIVSVVLFEFLKLVVMECSVNV